MSDQALVFSGQPIGSRFRGWISDGKESPLKPSLAEQVGLAWREFEEGRDVISSCLFHPQEHAKSLSLLRAEVAQDGRLVQIVHPTC